MKSANPKVGDLWMGKIGGVNLLNCQNWGIHSMLDGDEKSCGDYDQQDPAGFGYFLDQLMACRHQLHAGLQNGWWGWPGHVGPIWRNWSIELVGIWLKVEGREKSQVMAVSYFSKNYDKLWIFFLGSKTHMMFSMTPKRCRTVYVFPIISGFPTNKESPELITGRTIGRRISWKIPRNLTLTKKNKLVPAILSKVSKTNLVKLLGWWSGNVTTYIFNAFNRFINI